MNKSILVLEENSVIHGLIASALDLDGLTLHHEFNPARFVERARALTPDLILLSNTDQSNQYSILRKLKTQANLAQVPVVLLANSRDRMEGAVLKDLGVSGVIRKPFEASDVQQLVSKHLDLIDLVGSAYEYRQTQSTREDIPNPLAQLDVLENDVPALLRRGTAQPEPAPGQVSAPPAADLPPMDVPPMDLAAELSDEELELEPPGEEEGLAPEPLLSVDTTLPGAEETGEEDLGLPPLSLEEEAQEEIGVESFTAGEPERLGQDELLPEDSSATAYADVAFGPPSAAPATPEEAGLEELGTEDLLDAETLEETRLTPMEFDKLLQPELPAEAAPAAPALGGLDQIEVELSEEDLDFSGTPVTIQDGAAAAPPSRSPAADDSIPPAIRRMMELKPLFSKTDIQSDAGDMEPFLEGGDELPELQSMREPLATEPVIEEGEVLDLGEEELDDAGIMAAVAHEEAVAEDALDESDPDLLELRSSDELELAEVETLQGWNDGAALGEEPEDLMLDSEEDDLILTSLDLEEPGEAEPEASSDASRSTQLELSSLEQQAMQEVLDASLEEPDGPPPPMPGTGEGERLMGGDQDLPTLETQALNAMDEDLLSLDGLGAEDTLAGAPAEGQGPGELDFSEAKLPPLEEAAPDLWTLPEPEPLAPGAPAATEFTWEESTLGEAEVAEAQSAEPTPAAPAPAPAPAAQQGFDLDTLSSDSTEFDAAFAELREEIAANPEGERLDDLLRQERVQELIAGVEFTIPQHESSFARGMALYALPHGLRMDEAPRRPIQERAAPAAEAPEPEALSVEPLEAVPSEPVPAEPFALELETAASPAAEWEHGESLLDEASKARLSDVLDEIISLSVRQAVREEMPKLVERLVKEPS